MGNTQRPQVYFNSACPVCRAGINAQRAITEGCGVDIEWIDIARTPDATQAVNATVDEVRERLHVKDEQGRVYVGAAAFIAIWKGTAKQRWLGSLAGLPVFNFIFNRLYNIFARYLFRWNRNKGRW